MRKTMNTVIRLFHHNFGKGSRIIQQWVLLAKRLYPQQKPGPIGISAGPIFRPIFSEDVSNGAKINNKIGDERESVY